MYALGETEIMYTGTRARMHRGTHAHTYTELHTHTHTHTYTHTHRRGTCMSVFLFYDTFEVW